MKKKIEKYTVEELTNDLINSQVDVNEISLTKANQRDAFKAALKKHPRLLRKVNDENAAHFIKFALNEDYEYFTCLKREQYTDELVQLYLQKRLQAEAQKQQASDAPAAKKFSFNQTLDEKLLLQYSYVTPEKEELYYFDKELQVPLALKSSFKIQLKLLKTIKFIEKIDIEPAQLGENRICAVLSDLLSNPYKEYLSKFIESKNIGYYTLCSSISDLENGLKKEFDKVFDDYGIEVKALTVKQIAIPKDMQYKLEDQAFQIRQRRVDVEADAEFAKKSLENYEAKLSLEEKYPNATHTLTEYEKDLALKRYLIKTGKMEEEKIDHSIAIKQKVEQQDSTIEKSDIVPDVEPKKNSFKQMFFTLMFAFAIIAFIVMGTAGVGAGFIMLAVGAALFGTVGAICRDKFQDAPVEIAADDDSESEDVQQ